MIERLALKLSTFIGIEAYSNPKDRAKIQYGMSILLSEGFKVITLILFFNIIKLQNYFYFSLCILLTIRVFSGGVHIKGTLNCLLLTILLFTFTSVLAPTIPKFHTVYYLSVSIMSLAILLAKAPICSVERPIKDNKKKLQYKLTATLAVVLWTIVLFLLGSTPYVNCGFSTIFIQCIQLLLIKKPKL